MEKYRQLGKIKGKQETLREELLQMRSKVNAGQPHLKDEDSVRERYLKE